MTPLGMLQWPEELVMLDQFMDGRGISTALEIGTGPGGLTQWLGERIVGMLVSIDLPSGTCTGLSLAACEARNRQLEAENPAFVGVLGDSHDPVVIARVHRLFHTEPIDLLFIDGDHSFSGLSQDYETYKQLVRAGGVVAFHDINADAFESRGVDVPRFWRGLVGNKHELSVHGDWGGIGVIIT